MGRLLDAEEDGLREGSFQVFEMEHVMNKGDVNAAPVLTYLFHRIEQRLTGRPTLIVIEEAWLMLTHGLFAEKLEEWLRVLRKANAAVVFVTQSLAEVFRSPRRDLLLESCPTRLFLPNPGRAQRADRRALPADRSQRPRDRDPRRGDPQAPLLLRLAPRAPAHRSRPRPRRAQLRRGLGPRGAAAARGRSSEFARQRLAGRVAGQPRPARWGRGVASPQGEKPCLEVAVRWTTAARAASSEPCS